MIDLDRWNEIKEIVQAALDLPETERIAYLDEACQGDEELQRQAGILLAVSATQADAYDNFSLLAPTFYASEFKEGDEIGAYQIVRRLGVGGMATVYLADDPRHKRQVALKVLRTPRRQRREEQTVARFHHPNIVIFHESGQVEDGPAYFVMEYVDGETITAFCEAKHLSIDERLRLFLTVCDAVAYAHRHLVVHRDLKPSNILVRNDGVPKLLDFGIAKNLPSSLGDPTATEPENQALTLAFASPEQLTGETTSTAADIYSLGVLLCLLLTGHLPYKVKSYYELPLAIRLAEPKKPSQLVSDPPQAPGESDQPPHLSESETRKLQRTLQGDLDAIVLKALRKEPEKRYQTVAELTADIEHYLKSEPVTARKGSRQYRAGKFLKRHAKLTIAASLVILVILSLLVGLFIQQRETANQRDQAQDVARVLNEIFTTNNPWSKSGDQLSARELLDQASNRLKSLSLEPVRQATALHTLGSLYGKLGINKTAKQLLSQALGLRIKSLGNTHNDTIDTADALGSALYYLGEYEEAERLLLQAEQTRRIHDKPHLVSTLTSLARVRFEQGKPSEAEKLEREALQLLNTSGRSESPEAADLHSHLGLTLSRLDRLPEAEKHLSRSLQLRLKLFGDGHPETAIAHQNLALNLNMQSRYREAEMHYRKALAIARKSLPKEHPFLPAILDSLAGTCAHQKHFKEAEALVREGLTIKMQILPADHPAIPLSRINVASIIIAGDIDRLPEVEPLFESGIASFRKLAGDRSRQVGLSLYSYGLALLDHKEPSRAKPILEEAFAALREVNGADHYETMLVGRIYARALLEINDPSAAEPLLLNALRVSRQHEPVEPIEIAKTLSLLGRCHLQMHKPKDASDDFQEAYSIFSRLGELSTPEGKDLVTRMEALSKI